VTAADERLDTAMTTLSSCSSVKFANVYRLMSADHPIGTLPVTSTSEPDRVFSILQQTLTSIRWFYHDEGSTRVASHAAMSLRPLCYARRRAQRIYQESQTT